MDSVPPQVGVGGADVGRNIWTLKNNHLVPIEAELNCCVELSLKREICESLKFLDQLGCDDTNVEGDAKLKSV